MISFNFLILQKFNCYFLIKSFPRIFKQVLFFNSEIKFIIYANSLLSFLTLLKKFSLCQFKCLLDLVAIDYVINYNRFHVCYLLLSPKYNTRVKVIVDIKPFFFLPSVTPLFSNAQWLEREVWDLFGLFFFDNSNLRRILTDYGFKGHPLRKNFPLTGFFEVFYSDIDRRIKQVPVQITEDRHKIKFNFFWK